MCSYWLPTVTLTLVLSPLAYPAAVQDTSLSPLPLDITEGSILQNVEAEYTSDKVW